MSGKVSKCLQDVLDLLFQKLAEFKCLPFHFFLLEMAFQIATPPILSEKVKTTLSVHFGPNSVLHWRKGPFLSQPCRGVAVRLSNPQRHPFPGHGARLLPGRLAETQPHSVHSSVCWGKGKILAAL